jgi:addiction module HigA family antidote
MNDRDSETVGPMLNPPHLGELIRESMEASLWNVTETAARLGCERGTLSRLLNGRAGVSANMALALEKIGWGTAEHWMRMQASYELAHARRERDTREQLADARLT